MDYTRVTRALSNQFPSRLRTIDSHTAGEATRLIIGGIEQIPGDTMKDKLYYFKANMDHIRLLLTREPRGKRGTMAALVTEPVSKGADFGLIYMDDRRYPYLCGHATIGAVMTLIEAGVLEARGQEMIVIVDTPSGPMETRAEVKNGKIQSVAIQMVPSFVYKENQTLDVPGIGRIVVDLVCVGGFFVMVSADQIGMQLVPSNSHRLIDLGMSAIEAANQPFINSGPLETTFEGRIVTETRVGDLKAVIAEIRGNAHITGIHEFVLDACDPFPEGFLI
jgi:proline racemase